MSPSDNEDVAAPSGGLTKTPTQTGGRWRNLITIGGSLAAIAGIAGWIGFGVGQNYENLPTTGSATRTESNIIIPLLVNETSPGTFKNGTGSGYQIIVGIGKDGTIYNKSGALLFGPIDAPTLAFSGVLMRINGGLPEAGQEFAVVGDMSGSTLTIDAMGARVNKVSCYKAGGLLGYYGLSSSGTILSPPTCL